MKTGTVLVLGAAGLAAYYFAQLGVAGATVQFVFQGVDISQFPNIRCTMLIQNVSNAAVELKAMDADITLNGNDIGNASFFPPVPVEILPTSQTVVPFNLALSLLSLPSAIQNMIAAGSGSYTFVASGNANINGLVVPFSLTKVLSV